MVVIASQHFIVQRSHSRAQAHQHHSHTASISAISNIKSSSYRQTPLLSGSSERQPCPPRTRSAPNRRWYPRFTLSTASTSSSLTSSHVLLCHPPSSLTSHSESRYCLPRQSNRLHAWARGQVLIAARCSSPGTLTLHAEETANQC